MAGRRSIGPVEGQDLGNSGSTQLYRASDESTPGNQETVVSILHSSDNLVEAFSQNRFKRVIHRVYGHPPKRVQMSKPPLRSFALHRYVYYWLYVLLRLYKPKWLRWLPIPRPSSRVRYNRAVRQIATVQLYARKTGATFSRKGGVGKTSIVKARAGWIKLHRTEWNILVQDNNPDSGTLGDRSRRTTSLALADLVEAVDSGFVRSKADFAHYCNVMEEGSYLLASNPPDDYEGDFSLTVPKFKSVHGTVGRYIDVHLYDCGTDSGRATNLRALLAADFIELVTTPAQDSLKQTMQAYVWMCKHAAVTSKHVVLVVNRMHWWTNLDDIEVSFLQMAAKQFTEEGVREWTPKSFSVMGVGWDPRLHLGLDFTATQLRRSVIADHAQIEALELCSVADTFSGEPAAGMSHRARMVYVSQKRRAHVMIKPQVSEDSVPEPSDDGEIRLAQQRGR